MSGNIVLDVLYDPSDQGHIPDLDLVFVHGLGGNVINTWTHKPSGVAWPRDLLPIRRPLTRVLAYGYDGDMHETDSVARIRDHARTLVTRLTDERDEVDPTRPIVFVAHCLGGLILAIQALCVANNETEEFGPVATATAGIMLFGTPNFGTTKKQIRTIANAFSGLEQTKGPSGSRPLAGLAEAIIRNSVDLKEISEDFCQLQSLYEITNWYETRKLPGAKKLVVDQLSACALVPNQKWLHVDGDHINMCQFMGVNDGTFKEVCKKIKQAVDAYNKATAPTVNSEKCRGLVQGEQMQIMLPANQDVAGLQTVKFVTTITVLQGTNENSGVKSPFQLLDNKSEGDSGNETPVWKQDSKARVETMQGKLFTLLGGLTRA
ncbi:Protein SERAC1 [Madurella mycetomatis]|uniref:Protein SERAC1 n=1 Tax=Madurella mycetomatis TaxID=100816 RepID=A0A175WH09_9PEZI|nr:Protein SERAC1 [Madurella mycetomatis]